VKRKFEPWTTAYSLLGKKVERFLPEFEDLHINLRRSGVPISFKAYVAFMFFISIIAFLAALVLSLIMLPLIMRIGFFSGNNFLFSFLLAGLSAVMTLVLIYAYPNMKASNRRVPIENDLPYISSFLTLLSSSNVPPSTIFSSVARIDTLKTVRHEFSNIVRDVEIFGEDLMNAIMKNAKFTPNDKLRELLIGYVATIRTGGNPTEYLKVQSEAITKERIGKLDMMLESLSALAEIYVMVLVAMPLLFVVLFATLGMIGGAQMNANLYLYLLTYAGIPLMGAVMMVLMSTMEK
jgi:archaeal flagellar protein FlaJ